MEINEFIKKIRECEKSYQMANLKGLKVFRYSETYLSIKIIPDKHICKTCGTDLTLNSSYIEVYFNAPQKNLSIFEANLLFMVFKLNKLPHDYENFHKCIAGNKFINNIKDVKC